MSTSAARRAADVLANSQRVVAIEFLAAAHALWWRRSQGEATQLGAGTERALNTIEVVLGGRGGPAPPKILRRSPRRFVRALSSTRSSRPLDHLWEPFMTKRLLDGSSLTVEGLEDIAKGAPVGLAPHARDRMVARASQYDSRNAREILRRKWSWLGAGEAPEDGAVMVRAFIEGHCGAVGAPLERVIVRAMMVARVNVLATGYAGVRPEVAEVLLAMLNADVVPVVPSQGSVGAAARHRSRTSSVSRVGMAAVRGVLERSCRRGGDGRFALDAAG